MGKRGRQRHRREASVQETLFAAVTVLRSAGFATSSPTYRGLLEALEEQPAHAAAELHLALDSARQRARELNWSPADIRRQAERTWGIQHREFAVAGRWVPAHGTAGLSVAVEVLALLVGLPPLPRLGPAPGQGRRPHDARVLEKVRALLAKAESTTFPEEAEALSAKAQELMARHAIDAAMVGAGDGAAGAPTGVRLPVDDPYAGAKSMLLSEVASANCCRAVWSKGLGFSTVMGFDADLEFVEVLYTSLLVQATSAMVAAGAHVDRYGRSRTRSFRQAFLLAYAVRIGDRLRSAEATSRAAAAEEYGAALVPVLADRTSAVEAAAAGAFPGMVNRSVSVSNAAGWAAGSAAADLASLAGRTEMASNPG